MVWADTQILACGVCPSAFVDSEKSLPEQRQFHWITQVVEKIRQRGVVQVLVIAFLPIVAVFGILAVRADASVQLAIVIVGGTITLGLFGAIVLSIKYLGVYAVLDTSKVITYRKLEIGAKGLTNLEDSNPVPDPKRPKMLSPSSAPDEEEEQ